MHIIKSIIICSIALLGLGFNVGTRAETIDDASLAYFVSLSDIHFDPFMFCTEKPCATAIKLKSAPASEWPRIFAEAKSRPQIYREETGVDLLRSSLAAAKKQADARHAKFVIILGDFIGHSYRYYYPNYTKDESRAGYQDFVKKSYEFLNAEIARAFPDMDVYSVVGNNDSYVDDYVSHPHGRFFSDLAHLWSTVIKSKANRQALQNQFPAGGYYSVLPPGMPNVRLIVLNSVLFSNRGHGKGLELGALEELDWLHKQLQAAKDAKQKVLIAMHIPVGIDVYASLKVQMFTLVEFWEPKYTARFQMELKEFAPDISGILVGHLHSDWFQLIKVSKSNPIPVTGTPSISPVFGNNPGFKVYSYALAENALVDYTTFYYPLSGDRTWETEYEFSQVYQPNCRICPIAQGMARLQSFGDLAEKFKLYFAVSTTSQPITDKWNPYYWCAIHEINIADYQHCIN